MPSITEQLDLEKRMIAFGVTRYRKGIQKAEDKVRAADTNYATKLMQEFIRPVSEEITAWASIRKTGAKAKYRSLIQTIDADKAAYLTLRAVFNHFTKEEPLASLAIQIGTMVEDESRFRKFHEEHKNYYEAIIQDFRRKGTKNYRHMHRVLTLKSKTMGVRWNSWTTAERAAVGVKLIDCVIESTDLIKKSTKAKGKRKRVAQATIVPTQECLDWVKKFQDSSSLLNPDRVPCIIPPDPWESFYQGGYYSPQLRSRTPLVKTRSEKHKALLETSDMSKVCEAVNILQEVPWTINQEVYTVLKSAWDQSLPVGLPQSEPYQTPVCPLPPELKKEQMNETQKQTLHDWKVEARIVHTMEKERVSKCFQVMRVLRLANEFKAYDKFWYVYQCDFRGRIYTTVSGLSPQGADFAKSILKFAEPKAIDVDALRWLRIHGANCFGKDKLSYEDRIKWVRDNEELIRSVAREPLSNKDLWSGADKPWQFLAFCIEYERFLREGLGMLSYLPVGLDGSCNGLQNFSAMLRDEIGGAATNLIPAKTPADIYTQVAVKCTEKLRKLVQADPNNIAASKWLSYAKSTETGALPRGLSKKPVMTLPYGSTQQSCRESIYKFILDEMPDVFVKEERFHMSCFLTPILWESIGDVVVSARRAMGWIQSCAATLAKQNKPCVWDSPVGFPVYQDRKKIIVKQIHTELAGHFRLRLNVDGDLIDTQKQKLGASPNFVHSMDAAHLMLTLLKARDRGVGSFACIHDDFGTHAADCGKLHWAIREAFVEMYSENNPLSDFKAKNEGLFGITLPEIPPSGSLNIAQVIDSLYFFG